MVVVATGGSEPCFHISITVGTGLEERDGQEEWGVLSHFRFHHCLVSLRPNLCIARLSPMSDVVELEYLGGAHG